MARYTLPMYDSLLCIHIIYTPDFDSISISDVTMILERHLEWRIHVFRVGQAQWQRGKPRLRLAKCFRVLPYQGRSVASGHRRFHRSPRARRMTSLIDGEHPLRIYRKIAKSAERRSFVDSMHPLGDGTLGCRYPSVIDTIHICASLNHNIYAWGPAYCEVQRSL